MQEVAQTLGIEDVPVYVDIRVPVAPAMPGRCFQGTLVDAPVFESLPPTKSA